MKGNMTLEHVRRNGMANKGTVSMKLKRQGNLNLADWAVYNGFCSATQYKLAKMAGFTIKVGRGALNLFTIKDNQKMLAVKPKAGRPCKVE